MKKTFLCTLLLALFAVGHSQELPKIASVKLESAAVKMSGELKRLDEANKKGELEKYLKL